MYQVIFNKKINEVKERMTLIPGSSYGRYDMVNCTDSD